MAVVSAFIAGALGLVTRFAAQADDAPELAARLLHISVVLVILGVLLTMVDKLGGLRAQRASHERERRAHADRLLTEGLQNGRLPQLSEVAEIALGPTPTRHGDSKRAPYVARLDTDRVLREALRAARAPYPFVVLRGAPKAGKSRTALEAVKDVLSDPQVIIPHDGKSLAEFASSNLASIVNSVPALVWLDDLATSDLDHLTGPVIERLRERAVIVGTITNSRYDEILRTGSAVRTTARTTLRRASHVELPFNLTDAERHDAHRLYPHERFDGGIGEALVGGEELLIKFRAGGDDHPAGHALVQAAVDWRRVGVTGPITERALRQLFRSYLQRLRGDLAPTDELFRAGLQWASRPIASRVALLTQTSVGDEVAWDVLDYIVAAEEGQDELPARPIPDALWPDVLDIVEPEQALDIGVAALSHRRYGTSILAFQVALESFDDRIFSLALDELRILVNRSRGVEQVSAALADRSDAGTDDNVTLMNSLCSELLFECDHDAEVQQSERRLEGQETPAADIKVTKPGKQQKPRETTEHSDAEPQDAVTSGNKPFSPSETLHLIKVLARLGNSTVAGRVFQYIIDTGLQGVAVTAAFHVGRMLTEHGDTKSAISVYEYAAEQGDPFTVDFAKLFLAKLRIKQGDLEGALMEYRHVIRSDHKLPALLATNQLRTLLADQEVWTAHKRDHPGDS